MNISLILFNKTLSMLLMALIGYVLLKRGLLSSGDKRALNIINLYAVSPCVILTAFQVALTPDKVTGLITAFAGAISVHIIFLLLAASAPVASNVTMLALLYDGDVKSASRITDKKRLIFPFPIA